MTPSYAGLNVAREAFEKSLRAKMVGMEFYLNLLLDPLAEEGKAALQEYLRERDRKQVEQN